MPCITVTDTLKPKSVKQFRCTHITQSGKQKYGMIDPYKYSQHSPYEITLNNTELE